ncbi:hypothetical protein [Lacinutrix salivirga]
MNILNYQQSPHFKERLLRRQIDPFLVSLCLIKGNIKKINKNKVAFTLNKEIILLVIDQGYLLARDCLGLKSLTVITRKNILITVFAKFGDTGIYN